MDSLTQIVLGAATGEAVLGKKIGNKALLWGAIAGTIPDLDVMIGWFTDKVTANELHRGFSHSIFFCVLFAPIFGYLVHKLYKKQEASWKDWSWLFFWGLFTHPILDAFTTWGTQLFWPANYKVAFKSVFVVDPFYTVPFICCVIACLFFRRNLPKRSKVNWVGIGLSSSYLIISLFLKWYTYGVFKESAQEQGIPFSEIQTKPTPLNTFLWNANIKTKDAYYLGNYSIFDDSKKINFVKYQKNLELLEGIENENIVSRLKKLTDGWYTLQKQDGKLYFNDLRFGVMDITLQDPTFVFRYHLHRSETGELIAEQSVRNPTEVKPLLNALWNRILGRI